MQRKNDSKSRAGQRKPIGNNASAELKQQIDAFLAGPAESSTQSFNAARRAHDPKGRGGGLSLRHLFAFLLVAANVVSICVFLAWSPEKPDPKQSPGYKLWEQATGPGLTDSVEEAMKRVKLLKTGTDLLQPDADFRKGLRDELSRTSVFLINNEDNPMEGWEVRLQDHLDIARTHCALPQRGEAPPPRVTLFGFVCFIIFGGSLAVGFLRAITN